MYFQLIFGIYQDALLRQLILDRFLATVPDEPQVRGYTAMRRAESNSLLRMAQLAGPQRV